MKVKKQSDGKFIFWCPGCKCGHWFQTTGKPAWEFNCDLNRPTLRPSIRVVSGNEQGATCCHLFVTDGKIQFLGDCTHDLKRQLVEMSDWDDTDETTKGG